MQETCTPERFGIDTITVRGPAEVRPDHLAGQRLKRRLDTRTGELVEQLTSELASGVNMTLQIDHWRSAGPEASLELSVPRATRGDNRLPANPDEVVRAVQLAYDEASEVVSWQSDPSDFTVTRLDLARDFTGVRDAPTLLANLAQVPASRMQTSAYFAADGRGIETLIRSTNRHVSRLYDRAVMYEQQSRTRDTCRRDFAREMAQAETGVVRYELQLRRKQAEEEGVTRVSDLAAAPLFEIARRFFTERCQFGAVVAGIDWKLRDALATAQVRGRTKVTAAIGQFTLDALGLPGDSHPRTQSQYRRDYTSLGLVPADLLRSESLASRLDFATGLLAPLVTTIARSASQPS